MSLGPATTLSYRSHLLVAQKRMGEALILHRWDHTPSEKEVQARITDAAKLYDSFVLVTPCGPVLPGNFEYSYEM